MIEFKSIYKNYYQGNEEISVIKDLSLKIEKNKLCVFHGASGAGKTTLLNLIGGLERVDKGKILINDYDITHFSNNQLAQFRLEKIGFIFQSLNLISNLTTIENVMIPLLALNESYSIAKKKSLLVLDELGMSQYKNTLPKRLSGGEQQRVAIARALVKNPIIVLADEPTSSLDRKNTDGVIKILKQINTDKKSILIVVSHEPEIINLADERFEIKK